MIAAHRQWNRVGALDKPGAWTRRVVVNNAASLYQRRLAELRAVARLGPLRGSLPPALDAVSEHLWHEVRRLPRRQAQAVALFYVDDMTVATIAEIMEDLPDTELVDAYEIIDDASGDRTGIHQVYHQEPSDDSDGWSGREFLLRIQKPGTEFEPFDHYMPLAATMDTISVDGRTVTAYEIPDEDIEEGSYDLGMLGWTEAPGYEVILIPWGLDKDEALALLAGLTTINESQWDELKSLKDEPLVTTTIVEADTPTTGAVDAPDKAAPDGP